MIESQMGDGGVYRQFRSARGPEPSCVNRQMQGVGFESIWPFRQSVKTLRLDTPCVNGHTDEYVRGWNTIATREADVAECRAHTKAPVAGCLRGDTPLRISKR